MHSRTEAPAYKVTSPISLVRWGPLVAGLVVTLASGWLLSTIGAALGLSIADAADVDSASEFKGLGLGVVAWMFLSWMVAFFIGGATAGRLMASDDDLGKVHGFALWSFGTSLWIVAAFVGLSGLVATGTLAASGAATAGAVAASTAAGSAMAHGDRGGNAVQDAILGPISRRIEAEVKTEAGSALSGAGNTPSGEAAQQQPAQPGSQEAQELQGLDGETLAAFAAEIVAGRPETARDLLVSRTNLSAEQAGTVTNNVSAKVQAQVDEVKHKLDVAKQRTVDFTQAVLWAVAAGALLGLGACMLGGMAGVRCAVRNALEERPHTVTAPEPAVANP